MRRSAGIEMELTFLTDQRVLRWFGLVERMDEHRLARKLLMVDVNGRVTG